MKKEKKKEIILLLSIFLFFFLILLFVPITGDDWGNYIVGEKGIFYSLKNAINMYYNWEGRFVSRLLINIFTYHRIIYCFITSLLITALCYFLANFFQTKHKFKIYLITILFLLTLENTMWTQSFLWVAGSITYLFPCVLTIGYLYFYFHVIDKLNVLPLRYYLIFGIYSFLIVMFVENISFAYVFANILLLIYKFYKDKKIDKFILINTIISLIGGILMLISPGSRNRLLTETSFEQLSLLSKIFVNIPNFVYYTLLFNVPFLVILLLTNLSLIKKFIQKRKNKLILYILVSVIFIPLIIIISLKQLKISDVGFKFLLNNTYLLLIAIIFIFTEFIYLFNKYIPKDKKILFILFISIGISSNLIMLFSPIWGARTSLFTTIFLFFSFLYLFMYLNENIGVYLENIIYIILKIVTLILIVFYLITYYKIHQFTILREESIRKQVSNKTNPMIIYTSPEFLLWGNNPADEYHINTFKDYYNIDKETNFIYEKKFDFMFFK